MLEEGMPEGEERQDADSAAQQEDDGLAQQLAQWDSAVGSPLEFWTEKVSRERRGEGGEDEGATAAEASAREQQAAGGRDSMADRIREQGGAAVGSGKGQAGELSAVEEAEQGSQVRPGKAAQEEDGVAWMAAAKVGTAAEAGAAKRPAVSAAQRERRKKEALAGRGAKKSARGRQGGKKGGGTAGAAAGKPLGAKRKARPAAGIKASAKLTKKARGRRAAAAVTAAGGRTLLAQPDQAGLLQEQALEQGFNYSGSGEAAFPGQQMVSSPGHAHDRFCCKIGNMCTGVV